MRLPAVAIAAAFAIGIALGLHPAVILHVTSVYFLSAFFIGELVLIVAGLALATFGRLLPAAATSLLTGHCLAFLELVLRSSRGRQTNALQGCSSDDQ